MKKTIIKIFKRILIVITSILLVSSFMFYKFTANKWKYFYSEKKLKNIVDEIKLAPKLPLLFYNTYERVYPKRLEENLNKFLIKNLLSTNKEFSPPLSLRASRLLSPYRYIKNFKTIDYIQCFASVTWKIEERTNQKECLNWYLTKYDFLNTQIGVRNASQYYFNKKLKDLNENEILGLIVMLESSLYNPKTREDIYNKRKKELFDKIKKR